MELLRIEISLDSYYSFLYSGNFSYLRGPNKLRKQTQCMLVSIIIPMYRVELVLPQCLNCLMKQTYKRLEVIFVDDCSPDRSSMVVREHTEALKSHGYTVKLIRHDVNSGVAAARNTGLDAATGDFIYYLDADDALNADAIELMVRQAQENQADIVGINWWLSYSGHERQMQQPKVSTGVEAFEKMCYGVFKWNLWLFLVRRELYEAEGEKLRFLSGQNMGEDMMLMGKLFLRADKIAMLDKPLYHYVKTNEGSLTANYTDQHWQQVDKNLRELETYTKKHYPTQAQWIVFLKLNLKLPLLISPRKTDYQRWATWFTEANSYIMANPMLPLRTKCLQKAAALGHWWFVRLYYETVMRGLYSILYK